MEGIVDPKRFIGWFEGIDRTQVVEVGGKGASLGDLAQAGIEVPPGFVVTTTAFRHFLSLLDPQQSIRRAVERLDGGDLLAISADTKAIRDKILAYPLSAGLRAAVEDAYRRLCGPAGDVPVAVRSSATSEDSADASFAGMQETFLWVSGIDDICRYLHECWASLYSAESVAYRRRIKLPEDHLAMGVVIQRMVDPRCSGVMFTRSPTTGDRSVVMIEASWGLGSSIVSGEVTPDKYVVSKVTGEVAHRTVSHKAIQHVPDRVDGGVKEIPVPAEQQMAPCLSAEEIGRLTDVAKKIERHYGTAQDIEWAIDRSAESNIFVLQSRPETVWSSKAEVSVAQPTAKAFDHIFSLFRPGGGGA